MLEHLTTTEIDQLLVSLRGEREHHEWSIRVLDDRIRSTEQVLAERLAEPGAPDFAVGDRVHTASGREGVVACVDRSMVDERDVRLETDDGLHIGWWPHRQLTKIGEA
jgi:hypothetical protein